MQHLQTTFSFQDCIDRGHVLYLCFCHLYEKQHFAGIEFAVKGMALRLGKNDAGLTTGAGIHWRRFFVDYAFVNNSFKDVHRMSCAISL